MLESGGPTLTAEPSETWQATGPLASRVLEFAARVSEKLMAQGFLVQPAAFTVSHSPPEHVGLGVGTQLGLGAISRSPSWPNFPAEGSGRGSVSTALTRGA